MTSAASHKSRAQEFLDTREQIKGLKWPPLPSPHLPVHLARAHSAHWRLVAIVAGATAAGYTVGLLTGIFTWMSA